MKKNNALKMTILVVSIILISLISFVGIYKTENGIVKSAMPEYSVGKEFAGTRLIAFSVDTSNEEKTITPEEGGEEKTESVPVNSKEVLTEANYELAKNIIQKRLNDFGVINYDLRVDKTSGKIALEVADNREIDDILIYLLAQGKFQIIDTETEVVLLDNSHIKEAKTMYYTDTEGTNVYLDIVFDEKGKTILEEISKTYVETTDAEGKTTKKTVTIKLDDDTITTTYFGQTMSTGELPLTIGNPTTDANTLQNYFVQSAQLEILMNNGVNPIVYDITTNEYVSPIIGEEVLSKIVLAVMVVVGLMLVYLVIRYGTLGIISALSMVGYIALYLLAVRFTDTVVSLEAMAAIGISILLQFVFVQALAKAMKVENVNAKAVINKELIKNISIQIPLYIMAIVFVFASWETIKSFGIAMFWGLAISLLYNLLFTRTMFIQKEAMKK